MDIGNCSPLRVRLVGFFCSSMQLDCDLRCSYTLDWWRCCNGYRLDDLPNHSCQRLLPILLYVVHAVEISKIDRKERKKRIKFIYAIARWRQQKKLLIIQSLKWNSELFVVTTFTSLQASNIHSCYCRCLPVVCMCLSDWLNQQSWVDHILIHFTVSTSKNEKLKVTRTKWWKIWLDFICLCKQKSDSHADDKTQWEIFSYFCSQMHSHQISNCWFSHKCLFFIDIFIKFHSTLFNSMHSNVNFNNSLFIFNSIFFPTHHNLFCRIYCYSVVVLQFYICNLLDEK